MCRNLSFSARLVAILFAALPSVLTSFARTSADGSGPASESALRLVAGTVDTARLYATLDAYLDEIDHLSIYDAQKESDFIISSVGDSIVRSGVASRIYRHFRNSKVMGSENVAVHLFDKWFSTFAVLFPTVDEMEEAELHALVNRGSLIGRPAARLRLPDAQSDSLTIPRKGRKTILYFYSTECPKCMYVSLKLCEFAKRNRVRTDLVTVYAGDDDSKWAEYLAGTLKIKSTSRTKIFHLKGGDENFILPYGVVKTPRLFLIDEKGIIEGRQLDVPALEILLGTE